MAKGIGWLRRLLARFYYRHHGWGEPVDRAIDLSLGHPAASTLLQHIADRRWSDCESLFLSLQADERFVLLGYCAHESIPNELLEEWTSTSKSWVANLFQGTAMCYAAWEIRGEEGGDKISDGKIRQFIETLEKSWDTLIKTHESVPEEPEPLARLIPVAMGLELEADVVRELMARCANTGVMHLGAALAAVEALSGKWSGSPDEALDFAREHAEQFPRDRVVIACAHVENWAWEGMQDDGKTARQYFARPEVQRDLRECWGRETTMAQRQDLFRFHALNYYAMCGMAMEDEELAREALQILGTGVTRKPWIYSTDKPVLVVNTARLHLDLPSM